MLAALAANNDNVAKTARETGVATTTIRRWRAAEPQGESAQDLTRYRRDSWEIIHKANDVVREKVDELGAKDAASIAAGYFDRQSKAGDQLAASQDTTEEFAAEWDQRE